MKIKQSYLDKIFFDIIYLSIGTLIYCYFTGQNKILVFCALLAGSIIYDCIKFYFGYQVAQKITLVCLMISLMFCIFA